MLDNLLPIITFIIAVSGVVGTALTYRNAKTNGLSTLQKDTIEAMQKRIDTLEGDYASLDNKYIALTKENNRLSGVIETICSALKHENLFLTIEGEMITIKDNRARTTRNVVRKSTRKPDTTTGGT